MKSIYCHERWRLLFWLVVVPPLLVVRFVPLMRPGVSWATKADSIDYIELASGLTSGCGFARQTPGHCAEAELVRTPGYPVFLAGFSNLRTALVLQDVLGAMVILVIALFVCRWLGIGAAAIAAMLLGLDIPFILASNSLLSETLFSLLLTAALLLQLSAVLDGRRNPAAVAIVLLASLLIGLAAMVRPIGEVLILLAWMPAVFLPRLVRVKRVALALLAIAIPAAIIAGWSYRNLERRGAWTFSTIAAINTYYYRAAGVLAYEDGRSFDVVQLEMLQANDHPIETLSPTMTWELGRHGRKILLNDPKAFCIVALKGFLRTAFWIERSGIRHLCGIGAPRNEAELNLAAKTSSTLSYPLFMFLIFLEFGVIVLTWTGVGLALWRLRGSSNGYCALIVIPLSAALLLLAAAAGPESYDRFRVPVMPLLALVSAAGWVGHYRNDFLN